MAIGEVVIQFEGTAVNFRRQDFPFLPAAHRIVMVNASTITRVWNQDIAPHMAGFSTDLSPDTPAFPISGSVVQIANALKTGVSYVPKGEPGSYDAIPSLAALNPNLGLTPDSASLAVLVGHNPSLTACCFDVDDGVIGSAVSDLGATMTIVTIKTTSDPLYQLQPFPTGLSSRLLTAMPPQPATDKMFFWNAETDATQASPFDFLLNYLILRLPPAEQPAIIPVAAKGNRRNRRSAMLATLANVSPDITDVGCSNSNFP